MRLVLARHSREDVAVTAGKQAPSTVTADSEK